MTAPWWRFPSEPKEKTRATQVREVNAELVGDARAAMTCRRGPGRGEFTAASAPCEALRTRGEPGETRSGCLLGCVCVHSRAAVYALRRTSYKQSCGLFLRHATKFTL